MKKLVPPTAAGLFVVVAAFIMTQMPQFALDERERQIERQVVAQLLP